MEHICYWVCRRANKRERGKNQRTIAVVSCLGKGLRASKITCEHDHEWRNVIELVDTWLEGEGESVYSTDGRGRTRTAHHFNPNTSQKPLSVHSGNESTDLDTESTSSSSTDANFPKKKNLKRSKKLSKREKRKSGTRKQEKRAKEMQRIHEEMGLKGYTLMESWQCRGWRRSWSNVFAYIFRPYNTLIFSGMLKIFAAMNHLATTKLVNLKAHKNHEYHKNHEDDVCVCECPKANLFTEVTDRVVKFEISIRVYRYYMLAIIRNILEFSQKS